MDDSGKPSVVLVKAGQLVDNEELTLGVNRQSVDRAKKMLADYGATSPPVVRQVDGQEIFKVLNNQNIVNAINEIGTEETPVVIVDVKDDKDEKILSLKLSMINNSLGPIAQGALIGSLIESEGIYLGQLANILGTSKSWLSKRHTLVRNLSDPVKALVSSGALPPRSAEEVAKLPGTAQIDFATKVITEALPNDKSAKLVTMHNDPRTSDDIRKMILDNPSWVPLVRRDKPVKSRARPDEAEKQDASLRFTAGVCRNTNKWVKGLDLNGRLPDEARLRETRAEAKELSVLMDGLLRRAEERKADSGL